jgi:tRNA threonylcarbamoyladenosine biosynthesis protein TsaE
MSHPPIVKTLHWPDEQATERTAKALADCTAVRHAYIELEGDLGAGKTTLVRHLLRALGVGGRIKSPTYAVVEPYELADLPVWHFDFYRFNDPREWEDAGFREIFAGPGLKLAEWADKARGYVATPDLHIALKVNPDESREAVFRALTPTGQALLAAATAAPPAQA